MHSLVPKNKTVMAIEKVNREDDRAHLKGMQVKNKRRVGYATEITRNGLAIKAKILK